jgi:hypothetical protein
VEWITRCSRGPDRGRDAPCSGRNRRRQRRRRGRRRRRRRRAQARRSPVGGHCGAPAAPGRGGRHESARPKRRQGGVEGDAAAGRGRQRRRCLARGRTPARASSRADAACRRGRRRRRGTRPRQKPLTGGATPAGRARVPCRGRRGGRGQTAHAAASDQGMSGLGGRSTTDEGSCSPGPKPAAATSPRAAASDQGVSGLGGRSSSDEWSSSPESAPGPLPARETLRA